MTGVVREMIRICFVRVNRRELKIVPSDLPPARFRDPKERSRRDRLALIPNLDWRISDNDVLRQLRPDLR